MGKSKKSGLIAELGKGDEKIFVSGNRRRYPYYSWDAIKVSGSNDKEK
jgi:hypothetical protein